MDEGDDREQYWVGCVGFRAVSVRSRVSPQRLVRRLRRGVLEATERSGGRRRCPVCTPLDCWVTGAAIAFERDLAA